MKPIPKKQDIAGPTGGIRCWNGFVGCSKTIYGGWWNPDFAMWECAGYNSSVKLCNDCANIHAEKWGVIYSDLDLVFTAMQIGKAGKDGKEATREEIFALLKRLGAKHRNRVAQESALPVGDRL